MERKRYENNFKIQTVKLYETGKKASEIQSEYGISENLIYRWEKEYKNSGLFGTSANLSEHEKTIKAQVKEIQKLKMEVDILKQAALIIGRK